ncbi:MAG TPA: pilus assembly protein PilV [Methylophilaceae bacterium]|nr:pilus assembly protein PilV [Methylophilaceae bacterium]
MLEGLIAILIFSMGILAIVGLQAAAIKTVADSQYRLEASFLANQLIAQLWTDTGDISNYALPGGSKAANWKTQVESLLPGAASSSPTVNITGDAVSGYTVTVQLNWKAAGEANSHKYTTIAYINTN